MDPDALVVGVSRGNYAPTVELVAKGPWPAGHTGDSRVIQRSVPPDHRERRPFVGRSTQADAVTPAQYQTLVPDTTIVISHRGETPLRFSTHTSCGLTTAS